MTETRSIATRGRVSARALGPQERGDRRFMLTLLAPAVVILVVLFAYPLGYAGWVSVLDWNDKISSIHDFVGFGNYARLAADSDFSDALGRTLYFSAITVAVGVVMALVLALLLTQEFRGRTVVRVLLLVPWAVPPVVNGIMWKLMFDGDVGIVNSLLRRMGFIKTNVQWLAQPETAMNILIFAEIWKLVPFLTLLFIAALQGVPRNLYRAASIDGAGPFRRLVFITLPNIKGTLRFALIVQTMWSLKVFDTIYVLTGGSGGPAGGTTTINFFAYITTFSNLDRGYGASVAMVIMGIVLTTTVIWIVIFDLPRLIGRLRGPRKECTS